MADKFLNLSIRDGFSERNNIEVVSKDIQVEHLDKRSRICILNLWSEVYETNKLQYCRDKYILENVNRTIYINLYNEALMAGKRIPESLFLIHIKNSILEDSYNKVFDLLEYTLSIFDEIARKNNESYRYQNHTYYQLFNDLFQKEYIGYRFIDRIIVPITDPIEVQSIKEAFSDSYNKVREHISKANRLLSDRDNPDYENSIKESISALEALAQIITETDGAQASLGKMLAKLEEQKIITLAMKSAFSVLYGVASNSRGVRHSGNNGDEVSFEEAKYNLVISTAFVNYVMSKMKD